MSIATKTFRDEFSFLRHDFEYLKDDSLENLIPDVNIARYFRKIFRGKPYLLVINPFDGARFKSFIRETPEIKKKMFYSEGCVSTEGEMNNGFDIVDFNRNLVWRLAVGLYAVEFHFIGKQGVNHRSYLAFVNERRRWTTPAIKATMIGLSTKIHQVCERIRVAEAKPLAGLFLKDGLLKDIVDDIRDFVNSRGLYRDELKIAHRRGYLFTGVPGTGKTLAIRKIIEHFGFRVCKVEDKVQKDGRMNLQRINLDCDLGFGDDAPLTALVIEDLDRLVFQGTGNQDIPLIPLHALLNALDGIKQLGGFIVFASTNNPEILTESILRPGRIDRVWVFDLPGLTEIMRFLEYHGVTLTDYSLKNLAADNLVGYSMAVVESFVKTFKTRYRRSSLNKAEALETLKHIHAQSELFEKHFKNNGISIGFCQAE